MTIIVLKPTVGGGSPVETESRAKGKTENMFKATSTAQRPSGREDTVSQYTQRVFLVWD